MLFDGEASQPCYDRSCRPRPRYRISNLLLEHDTYRGACSCTTVTNTLDTAKIYGISMRRTCEQRWNCCGLRDSGTLTLVSSDLTDPVLELTVDGAPALFSRLVDEILGQWEPSVELYNGPGMSILLAARVL